MGKDIRSRKKKGPARDKRVAGFDEIKARNEQIGQDPDGYFASKRKKEEEEEEEESEEEEEAAEEKEAGAAAGGQEKSSASSKKGKKTDFHDGIFDWMQFWKKKHLDAVLNSINW